jgi:hypothetical protein
MLAVLQEAARGAMALSSIERGIWFLSLVNQSVSVSVSNLDWAGLFEGGVDS